MIWMHFQASLQTWRFLIVDLIEVFKGSIEIFHFELWVLSRIFWVAVQILDLDWWPISFCGHSQVLPWRSYSIFSSKSWLRWWKIERLQQSNVLIRFHFSILIRCVRMMAKRTYIKKVIPFYIFRRTIVKRVQFVFDWVRHSNLHSQASCNYSMDSLLFMQTPIFCTFKVT